MLLFKGGVLIYTEHCMYIYIYIFMYLLSLDQYNAYFLSKSFKNDLKMIYKQL